MIDRKKKGAAKKAFKTLCEMLDELKFKYEKHEADWAISFTMAGEDIPISETIYVDVDRELVRISSLMPATFKDEYQVLGAVVACYATTCLEDGVFEYDYNTGKIYFRMIASYADSILSKKAMQYLVYTSGRAIDDFNDEFLMLSKGKLSFLEFKKDHD